MRTSVKRALGLGVLGGAAFAAWRVWNARVPPRTGGIEWENAPFPFPPVPRPALDRTAGTPDTSAAAPVPVDAPARPAWVEPDADGGCPDGYPVKAKLSSGIFHVPGGSNYARTKPDRCYADADAAAADGLRPAKA